MLIINDEITIPENHLSFAFTRASGPGGQNVNKVATAVQLRFTLAEADYLTDASKARLRKLAGKRMTTDDVLLISAQRFRSQEKNRQDALDRLRTLILQALVAPKPRLKSRPSKTARERRLQGKRRQSEKKKLRRGSSPPGDDP